MKKVSDLMLSDFPLLSDSKGLTEITGAFRSLEIDSLPVWDGRDIVGVLRHTDVFRSHPNRLVADAMGGAWAVLAESESFWTAHRVFRESEPDLIVAKRSSEYVGLLPRTSVRLEVQRHLDPLTGLFRKSYLTYSAVDLLRTSGQLSVAFFDVNDFGAINKKLGHVLGDLILTEVGDILKRDAPSDCVVGRFGGDEFVLLSSRPVEETRLVVASLRQSFFDQTFLRGMGVEVATGMAGGSGQSVQEGQLHADQAARLINLASLASTRAKTEPGFVWIHKEE